MHPIGADELCPGELAKAWCTRGGQSQGGLTEPSRDPASDHPIVQMGG